MTVYILQSVAFPTKLYKGVTTCLRERIHEHNLGKVASTRLGRPWKLIVAIDFENAERALAFERYLKSGSGHAFAKRHLL